MGEYYCLYLVIFQQKTTTNVLQSVL